MFVAAVGCPSVRGGWAPFIHDNGKMAICADKSELVSFLTTEAKKLKLRQFRDFSMKGKTLKFNKNKENCFCNLGVGREFIISPKSTRHSKKLHRFSSIKGINSVS